MTEAPRLTVSKALTSVLEQITVANGYSTDVGEGNVFRGRVLFGDSDPVPMISILEVPVPQDGTTPDAQDNVTQSGPWELIIQGFVADDIDNPTDPAQALLFDIKKVLAAEKTRANGYDILGLGVESDGPTYTDGLKIGPGVVRPPDEVSAKAYCWVNIVIDLVEPLKN